MRGLRYSLGFLALISLPVQSFAADATTTSVNSHLAALSWFPGTYKCTEHVVYSNGKTLSDSGTFVISQPQAGWIQQVTKGQPGMVSYGYDPKKNKYVVVATSGPGSYGAGYFTVASDRSIALVLPDALDNDAYAQGDFVKFGPTANGYAGSTAGSSDRYPGLRYKSTFNCIRQ
jgi:hypothetical protein